MWRGREPRLHPERAWVVAFKTGGRLPSFNSVAVSSVDADPDTVCAFYDEVVATSLPHCVQVRPAVESRIEHILVKRGLARVEEIPLMARLGTQPPG
jgi:hypothetical protein